MAADQGMTVMQAVIKAAKAAMMAVREAENLVNNAIPMHTLPRSGIPALRQTTFYLKVADKYQDLCSFKIEVMDIFMTNNYITQEQEALNNTE